VPSTLALGCASLLVAAVLVPAAAGLTTPSSVPTFAPPVDLPDAEGFGEPSIAAAPDGTLYIVAPGTATWRSDNAGASWTRQANTLGNGGDSDVGVDLDGLVYGSDLSNRAPVSVSTNRAATYTYVTATVPGGNLDREWISVAGHGDVYATVRDGNALVFSASHDAAHTFSSPVTVVENGGWPGNILAASPLDLYIPYSSGGMKLAVSHDAGVTWTLRDVADIAGADCLFPAVARDAAGTLYAVWCELGGVAYPSTGKAKVFVTASADDGATWSTPVLLSDDADYNTYPWVTAGSAGRVMVAWYEGIPRLPDPLPMRDAGLAFLVDWHVEVAWSTTADQAIPGWQREAATGVSHSGPIAHELGGLLDFFEITEQPGGNLAIAYVTGGDLVPADLLSLGNGLGSVGSLAAVVQTGGPNLRAG